MEELEARLCTICHRAPGSGKKQRKATVPPENVPKTIKQSVECNVACKPNHTLVSRLDCQHGRQVTSIFPAQLIAPVSLDEIGPISRHAGDESLSSKVSGPTLNISVDLSQSQPWYRCHSRSAPSNRVLPLQAQLHVDNSE